jgi:hypothetical protein
VPKETPAKRRPEEVKREREWAKQVKDAVKRASEGDESALPVIRRSLDEKSEGWWSAHDLARMTIGTQVKQICEDNLFAKEILERQVERLKAELSGPDSSPLERLLVERIAACWLHVNYAEMKNAEQMNGATSFEASEYYQKRVDRAQRRYLAAIKALVQVRGLQSGIPHSQTNLQVNIGSQHAMDSSSGRSS